MKDLEGFKKQLDDNHVYYEEWGYPLPSNPEVYNTIISIDHGEDEETGLYLSFSVHFHDGKLSGIDLETD